MRRILITGKTSYIGLNLKKYLEKHPKQYEVEMISVRGDGWKAKNFSGYDVILHLAGIAHVSTDPKMEELYYKVNRDLTIDLAKKAKEEDVKQFIFMSSIIVYGDEEVITKVTKPTPGNFYGKSKLEAEQGILLLQDNSFEVVVIRPPMIYGKDSKGNYPKLAKAARILPVFPDIENQRSMLYVDNLCEFIKLMIDNEEKGLFFPQNAEYVRTSEMVRLIAEVHGKKIILTKIFNPVLRLLSRKIGLINKVFGDLAYDSELSFYKQDYIVRTFENSLKCTEEA